MSKKIVILSAIVALAIASGVYGVSRASAPEDNPFSTLVEKIATKFNLNTEEVQAVFEEHRTEMEQSRRTKAEERLTALVTEGEITEAQKELILQKQKELQSQREENRETWKNLSADERREKMLTEREELKAWAKENGIDMEYLKGGFGKGPQGGPGGPRPNETTDETKNE